MTAYIIRRLWHSLLVVIGVTIVVFILLHLLPGGPARAILGPRATPAAIAVFNRVNGFDQPIYVQYWIWIDHLVHGNLGYSYKLNQSVASLIADRLPKTVLLVGLANLAALIIAVPLGLLQASRRNKAFDYAITGGAFIFYSMPLFWLSLLLVIVFSIDLRWFPPEAPQGDLMQVLANPAGLVLACGLADPDHGGPVQPLHALLSHRQPDPGLCAHRPGQGPRARRGCCASTSCAIRCCPRSR